VRDVPPPSLSLMAAPDHVQVEPWLENHHVRIALDLRLVQDAVIRADNEDEARLGIQTLIDNGVYSLGWALGGEVEAVRVTILSIEAIKGGMV
jgi:hypothetical protein